MVELPRKAPLVILFSLLQLGGDLEIIEQALNKPKHARKEVKGSGSCSALIKVKQFAHVHTKHNLLL